MLTDRPKKKTKVFNKACLTCLLLLVGLGIVLIVVATQASGGSRPSHNFKHLDLEQFGAAASRDLTHCGPSSKASICKWARQYSRANRKRPADWKPKPGWQEDTAHDGQQARHISDRSLTALDNSSQPTSSHTATRPLSEVLKTLWPLHDQTQTAEQHPAALPQCAAFRGQSCVAILGQTPTSVRVHVACDADVCIFRCDCMQFLM